MGTFVDRNTNLKNIPAEKTWRNKLQVDDFIDVNVKRNMTKGWVRG